LQGGQANTEVPNFQVFSVGSPGTQHSSPVGPAAEMRGTFFGSTGSELF